MVLNRRFKDASHLRLLEPSSFSCSKQLLKGLILAQNERWRRGLGMQVVRQVFFSFGFIKTGGAAKGRVTRGYLPSDPG